MDKRLLRRILFEGNVSYATVGSLIQSLDAFPDNMIKALIKDKWKWVIVGSDVDIEESDYFGDSMESAQAFCDFEQREMCFLEIFLMHYNTLEGTVFHEMGHAIHYSVLNEDEKKYVRSLYCKSDSLFERIMRIDDNILSWAMMNDPEEYFAESVFLFLTNQEIRIPEWKDLYHPLNDILKSEDYAMYSFLEYLFIKYS